MSYDHHDQSKHRCFYMWVFVMLPFVVDWRIECRSRDHRDGSKHKYSTRGLCHTSLCYRFTHHIYELRPSRSIETQEFLHVGFCHASICCRLAHRIYELQPSQLIDRPRKTNVFSLHVGWIGIWNAMETSGKKNTHKLCNSFVKLGAGAMAMGPAFFLSL